MYIIKNDKATTIELNMGVEAENVTLKGKSLLKNPSNGIFINSNTQTAMPAET